MNVRDVTRSRRSIRAFHPERLIPRELLKQVIEDALWAPSWGNTQPWGFTVVGGAPLDKIKAECLERTRQGVPPNPEFSMPTQFNEALSARYKELGRSLFRELGIERGDTKKRQAHYEHMAQCLGAPQMIYLHFHQQFHPYALMDGGVILQTIALLAVEAGLGTCFLAVSVLYPDIVRKYARIPPERTLVMGMAIGYANEAHPANLFRSARDRPEAFIQWVE